MSKTVSDVACTMCGCVCDDLTLRINNGRVTAISPGCSLAEPWLLQQSEDVAASPRIEGQPVELNAAIHRAAELLQSSISPLIYGLSRSSSPGQRAAVALADRLGACIDTTASTCHAPSIMALQTVGESTCSLGEISNRADVVIYWGSNPLVSHPRHVERFVDKQGLLVPEGRTDRHLVVVDVERTETAEIADTFIQVPPGGDFELIWALRAIFRGVALEEKEVAGLPLGEIQQLAKRLKQSNYGTVFFGLGLTRHGQPHANVEALLRMTTDLNQHTRFVVRRMRVPGDVAGADSVLCWQTGFPFSVNLSRGYPRYNPDEYKANLLLERGEVDAALLVGSEGIDKLTPAAQDALRQIPLIILDYPQVISPIPGTVEFTTAVYGIHRPGIAYRMDEMPIPLRQVMPSELPADHEILAAITKLCQAETSEIEPAFPS